MKIQLSDHFTYKRLIRFVLPSIVMMVFTSVYGVVDGLFVSNYAGKTPFAAVNLIMPVIMIMGTVGLMIGTGGSAIVSKTLGEGKKKHRNIFPCLFTLRLFLVFCLHFEKWNRILHFVSGSRTSSKQIPCSIN